MVALFKDLAPEQEDELFLKVADALLPHPQDPSPETQQIVDAVLAKVREYLGIAANDDSEESRSQILDFVESRLASPVLEADEKAIKARLAESNLLPNRSFAIKFYDDAKHWCLLSGTRLSQVEETIREPDSYEHFARTLENDRESYAVSLFIKAYRKGTKRDYILLVEATRKAEVLDVVAVWKVLIQDVGVALHSSPLDVLRAFTNRYGLPIIFKGQQSRLIVRDYIPLVDGPQEILRGLAGNKHSFAAYSLVRKSVLGLFEVALAYALNTDYYQHDLRRRGFVPLPW